MLFYSTKQTIRSIKRAIAIRLIVAVVFSVSMVNLAEPSTYISNSLTQEQLGNYIQEDYRLERIIDIVYPKISKDQKECWRRLLLGTVAVESNFLIMYSKKTPNGNGPYQIIGNTIYGIIHSYVSYPLADSEKRGFRKELIALFEKVTNGRITWDELVFMDKDQLVLLCVEDYDFSALVSLLVYKDAFERNNIRQLKSDPLSLAKLWKEFYNTSLGVGTVERFVKRFDYIADRIAT